jgi:hypothetical protein
MVREPVSSQPLPTQQQVRRVISSNPFIMIREHVFSSWPPFWIREADVWCAWYDKFRQAGMGGRYSIVCVPYAKRWLQTKKRFG